MGLAVLTVSTTSLVGWLGIDEAYPFFQSVIYRLGQRFGPPRQAGVTRGLLILQIDGLSFSSLKRALDRGRMPTISAMLARVTHRLYRWNCGLPSNTPAVQAGLFYGARGGVPGYRWYDRGQKRARVASNPEDLRLLEGQAADAGEPLLEGGSCINSFMSGGAAKRLMTVTAVRDPQSERRKGEVADFNLFWLSPHAYTKAIMATLYDFMTALFWALLGRFSGGRPWVRMTPRRLAQRAVANAFLRETAYFWIKQDMVRGVPVIYSNFVGYDEVAHYSLPDAYEAQITLAALDRKLHRLLRMSRSGTPIAYEIVLLSDHGQTPSLPFRMLYGRSLESVVSELAGLTTPIPTTRPLTTNYVTALLEELEATRSGRPARTAARGRRTLERISRSSATVKAGAADPLGEAEPPGAAVPPGEAEPAAVQVCVSGCLAHIYFEGHEEPLSLQEINALYPGLVEGLASHSGVGFLAVRHESGEVLVIGGGGVRNLHSGEIRGQADPLAPFGPVEVWARELDLLVGSSASGDLIVNGAWLSEGRVVVFEEQSSSHGGLGGAQTEPFLIAPATWGTTAKDLASPESLHAHLRAGLQHLRPAS